MNPKRIAAIVCAIVCLVSLFIAIERYQTNASNVEAMNRFGGGAFGALGGGEISAATPAATKYALLAAALSGAGAVVLFVVAKNESASRRPERPERPERPDGSE